MKKLWVMIALILCAAIAFAGCAAPQTTTEPSPSAVESSPSAVEPSPSAVESSSEVTDAGLKKIGLCHQDQSWEMYVIEEAAIREQCEKDGVQLLTANASSDATKQMQQIETMIQSGVDAIIVVTVDGTVLEDTVKRATDAGIIVISEFIPIEAASVNILVDEYQYGYTIGQLAGEYCAKNFSGETIEAALLRMHNYVPGIERGKGMSDAFLEFFPTGKIVNDQDSVDVASAMTATEAILAANPDCRVFMCDSDDTGAIGAYQTLLAKVKPEDYAKYCVIGADGTAQGIEYVKEGGMYRGTIDIMTPQIGIQAYNALKDIKAGKTVEKVQYITIKPIDYDTAIKEY